MERRARLHGRITKTRDLHLHRITNSLVSSFDTISVEDLNLAGMNRKKGHLGRHLADASLGELVRQLDYKAPGRVIRVDRWFPSSKTCGSCGAVKAKLHRGATVFDCHDCGHRDDRDRNAAVNLAMWAVRDHAARMVQEEAAVVQSDVAGLRPETQNADPRTDKTDHAHGCDGTVRLQDGTKKPPPLRVEA